MAQIIKFNKVKETVERRKTRELIQRTLDHIKEIRQVIARFKQSNLTVVRKQDDVE
jgi:hypothetical protein